MALLLVEPGTVMRVLGLDAAEAETQLAGQLHVLAVDELVADAGRGAGGVLEAAELVVLVTQAAEPEARAC